MPQKLAIFTGFSELDLVSEPLTYGSFRAKQTTCYQSQTFLSTIEREAPNVSLLIMTDRKAFESPNLVPYCRRG